MFNLREINLMTTSLIQSGEDEETCQLVKKIQSMVNKEIIRCIMPVINPIKEGVKPAELVMIFETERELFDGVLKIIRSGKKGNVFIFVPTRSFADTLFRRVGDVLISICPMVKAISRRGIFESDSGLIVRVVSDESINSTCRGQYINWAFVYNRQCGF